MSTNHPVTLCLQLQWPSGRSNILSHSAVLIFLGPSLMTPASFAKAANFLAPLLSPIALYARLAYPYGVSRKPLEVKLTGDGTR